MGGCGSGSGADSLHSQMDWLIMWVGLCFVRMPVGACASVCLPHRPTRRNRRVKAHTGRLCLIALQVLNAALGGVVDLSTIKKTMMLLRTLRMFKLMRRFKVCLLCLLRACWGSPSGAQGSPEGSKGWGMAMQSVCMPLT